MNDTQNSKVTPRRVAVIWTQLSGYFNSSLKALADTEGIELFVSSIRVSEDAPFDESQFSWMKNHYQWDGRLNVKKLVARIDQFAPDVIISSGWNIRGHRYILKKFRNRAIRVITLDNSWRESTKQKLGILLSRLFLHPICDILFVAGERQAVFARKLGFHQNRIIRGVLTCDYDNFAAVFVDRQKLSFGSNSFAYVGRFVEEKGLSILVESYLKYRQSSINPWPLKCYGAGVMKNVLENIEGIELLDFCQPKYLPSALLNSDCLILPSTFEPWALVVHEAASTGMGIICSDAVGASVHLVQDGYNGYIVETGDVNELAQAMSRFTELSNSERLEFSRNSNRLASQFTPKRWSKNLLDRLDAYEGRSKQFNALYTPIITIITSTLNCSELLKKTIVSISEQTYNNIQWIVADGGSTDGTVELIKNCEKIKYWFTGTDNGIYDSWNKSIKYITGDWVLFFGAGDIFPEPETLERTAARLSVMSENIIIAYGNVKIIVDNEIIYNYDKIKFDEWDNYRPKLPMHQGVFSKAALFKKNTFDSSYSVVADSKHILCSLSKGRIEYLNIDVCLAEPGGISSNPKFALVVMREFLRLEKDLGYKIPIFRKIIFIITSYLKVLVFNIWGTEIVYKISKFKRKFKLIKSRINYL